MKRIIRPDLAVFADIVIEGEGAYALEFSAQRDLKNGWTLGPGVSLQRNGIGGDDFGAVVGINVAKVFGG